MQPIVTIHLTGSSIDLINEQLINTTVNITEGLRLVNVQLMPLMMPDNTIRMDGQRGVKMEWHLVAYFQAEETGEEISKNIAEAMGIDPNVMRQANERAATMWKQEHCPHPEYEFREEEMVCKSCGKIL